MKMLENIVIAIDNVSKKYVKKYGVKNVTTKFEQGTLNLLIGENGSGKSTLIKCIMGLVSYTGTVTKRKFKIGYAPEEYVMPEFMNVIEFLSCIGRIKGLESDLFDIVSIDYLGLFGLSKYRNKPIKSLSNGMKQKINLLQALIHDPKILILDEPLASLDSFTQKEVIKIINEKAKTALVIVSTHHPEKFRTKNKRIYTILDGELINNAIS
jgi:ABC-2 type transport system ATP-binding protein